MGNMVILQGAPISAIATGRGTGAANLLTPDPKEVWTDAAADGAGTQINIDLGSVQAIDTVFLGFTNATTGAQWSGSFGAAGYADSVLFIARPMRAADSIGPRHHAFIHLGGTVNARYIRLNVTQPNGAAALYAGIVMVGAAFQPTFNQDWGPSRRPIDTGVKTRLRGGGFATQPGAIVSAFQWTLAELTDAEVRRLWAIFKASGETNPVLVVEDPDAAAGFNEQLYYGLMARFDAFERQDPDLTKWGLSIEEWA